MNAVTPLTLADGTMINPETGTIIAPSGFVEIPKPSEMQEQRAISVRKLLADLPAPPQQMNAISLVVAYSLFGLSPEDIAVAMRVPVDIVQGIMRADAFNTMYQAVADGIVRSDKDVVHHMLSTASKRAAQKMVEFIESPNEATALNATKDVLDRSGFRPADVVEHKHTLEGGLVIEFVKREEAKNIPMIEVNPQGEF